MDKIINIKLNKLDIYEFCNKCESFESDIDLIDGSNILDAKDYGHIVLLDISRNFCVSINSSNKHEILRFNEVMEQYKVK